MKYFPWNLYCRLQRDSTGQAAFHEYRKNSRLYMKSLEKCRKLLSIGAYKLFSRNGLHDARIVSLNFHIQDRAERRKRIPANIQLVVHQRAKTKLWKLNYKDVSSIEIVPSPWKKSYRAKDSGSNYLWLQNYWWLHDEISILKTKELRHEILFHSGAIWVIECAHIFASSLPLAPKSASPCLPSFRQKACGRAGG